jgi:hypothetical protein
MPNINMLERLQRDKWHKWATYTFYHWTFYVAIKIFRRTKCPADRKFCRTKPIFDFFSRTNVRCPALFQGLTSHAVVGIMPDNNIVY